MKNCIASRLTIVAAITLAFGLTTQPRSAAAVTANELSCKLAHAELQMQLNGLPRCVKTVHEAVAPHCESGGFTYSVRSGEDKCVKLPANWPPPGSAVAVPTEAVACPPAAGNGPWQVVRDVTGIQDQCQRTRTEVVAPVQIALPREQGIPSPLKK
jgi:hypothetical protein